MCSTSGRFNENNFNRVMLKSHVKSKSNQVKESCLLFSKYYNNHSHICHLTYLTLVS